MDPLNPSVLLDLILPLQHCLKVLKRGCISQIPHQGTDLQNMCGLLLLIHSGIIHTLTMSPYLETIAMQHRRMCNACKW